MVGRPLAHDAHRLEQAAAEVGEFVRHASDRYVVLRPPYETVAFQRAQGLGQHLGSSRYPIGNRPASYGRGNSESEEVVMGKILVIGARGRAATALLDEYERPTHHWNAFGVEQLPTGVEKEPLRAETP